MLRFILLSVIILVSGCPHQQQKQTLREALFEYTTGIRWGRNNLVTPYLGNAAERYLQKREEISDLKVTKCRVRSVKVHSSTHVTVVVDTSWYRLSRGKLERTQVEQEWEQKEKRWYVKRQSWIKGSPLPIFPNPEVKDEKRVIPSDI